MSLRLMQTRRINDLRFSIGVRRSNNMYSSSITAIISAVHALFSNHRSLLFMIVVYMGLLAAIYLFVSTREATLSQLLLTFVTVVVAPALFFVLQAAAISYTNGPTSRGPDKEQPQAHRCRRA